MACHSTVLKIVLGLAILFFVLAFLPIAGRTGTQIFLGLSTFFFTAWCGFLSDSTPKKALRFIIEMMGLYTLQVYFLKYSQGTPDFTHAGLNTTGTVLLIAWQGYRKDNGAIEQQEATEAKNCENLPIQAQRTLNILLLSLIASVIAALASFHYGFQQAAIYLAIVAILLFTWVSETKHKFGQNDDGFIGYVLWLFASLISIIVLAFDEKVNFLPIPIALILACFLGLRRSY